MSLPYEWRPALTSMTWTPKLTPGDLIAYEHQAWRILSVDEYPPELVKDRYTHHVVLRPATSTSIMTAADEDKALSAGTSTRWWRYADEHYPVCAVCGEVLPCREQMIRKLLAEQAEKTRRYETPGVCPACEEPVSHRQLRQTWPDNIVVPNGQPVTFHLRRRCEYEAKRYDRLWMEAGRPSLLGFAA